jgi:hypothetical protein
MVEESKKCIFEGCKDKELILFDGKGGYICEDHFLFLICEEEEEIREGKYD